MGTARPLYKIRQIDWEARCVVLEQRDRERARELRKTQAGLLAANKNAARFHALLLQARVNLIREQKKTA